MATNKYSSIMVFLTFYFIFSCNASSCSSDRDCLHFEYCCKGNCTWKRLQCEHICQMDHDCRSESRCVLGMCENCTTDFSCTRKSCLNDSHCPGGHSCEKRLCEAKKESHITAEMAPFLIFITALSVSLLIVCYNDHLINRQQGWREHLERLSCNCSLALWFWMWKYRRSQQQSNDNSICPGIQVQFDARSSYPSNLLNEKSIRQTYRTSRFINRILFFWRRNHGDSVCESLSLEVNNSEESARNVQAPNPVVLLDQLLNNGILNQSRLDLRSSSYTRQQSELNVHRSGTEEINSDTSLNHLYYVLKSSELGTRSESKGSNDPQTGVKNMVDTCAHEVTTV